MALSFGKILSSLALSLSALLGLLQPPTRTTLSTLTLSHKNGTISAELASSPTEQAQGLSGRISLNPNAGMLFVFPDDRQPLFWMKDMNFPLDIVWIKDNKIIKIDKNLPPEGKRPAKTYTSGTPVNYVLEFNAGFCDQNNIKVGDEIKYHLFN